ncbi:DUF6290 family protein [Helicobacter canis]|uniref:CopG family transcriptional regulator n=1 Tax=Helicobacter canis TaxID=29419 RepID=A0A377J1V1_9HELI|nr:DUF6290 family protein [Helicobacter canis]STO96430.1 Uncharacterised protein [Helicobacter canis]
MSITINISQELQEAYQNFAREQNISQEELIQKALIAYMEDLEDLNAALEWQLKSKDEKRDGAIPAKELYKELGL